MKTIIQVHKEEDLYVAVDIVTNVADQGKTKEEAISNLKKGLEGHYQVLMEMSLKKINAPISFIDINIEKHVKTPCVVC